MLNTLFAPDESLDEILNQSTKELKDFKNSIKKEETVENLKSLGNIEMQNQNFEKAIFLYEMAIKNDKKNPILFSNLSEAYLSIGYNAKALEAANDSLEIIKLIVLKTSYRKCRALAKLAKI